MFHDGFWSFVVIQMGLEREKKHITLDSTFLYCVFRIISTPIRLLDDKSVEIVNEMSIRQRSHLCVRNIVWPRPVPMLLAVLP